MRRTLALFATVFAAPLVVALASVSGCSGGGTVDTGAGAGVGGSTGSGSTLGTLGTNGPTTTGTTGTNVATTTGAGSGTTGTNTSLGTAVGTTTGTFCTGLQCAQNQSCPGGMNSTTISGTIMDPAGADPLYNVVAYVPNSAVQPLPAGATCATCNSLFSGDPVADGLSDANGHFVITNAPASANVPVIIQVGKWRTHTTVANVVACQDNPIGTIKFPSAMDSSDGIINLPDIAVSTGAADSLECLLARIGISESEYVPGNSTAGKVHIFNGGNPSPGSGMGSVGGLPETNLMAGAPNSDQALWNVDGGMAAYDIVLLSCEGDETYDANPANLQSYLDYQGGRVFASHYHYAWFTGTTEGQSPSYTSPAEWGTGGNMLANWIPGSPETMSDSANANVTTVLGNGNPFPKGVALNSWLMNTNALGVVPSGTMGGTCSGLSPSQLCVAEVRENSTIVAADTASQGWITDPTAPSGNGSTLYFSFNTPINSNPLSEGSSCAGRAVFSGLHVGGASYDSVNCETVFGQTSCSGEGPTPTIPAAPPPAGCDTSHGLSPQEKALEFMLFDLSSCIVPDTAADAGNPIRFQ